jgi:transposase
MGRFIEGADRTHVTLLPEVIDDYLGADNPVRVVDAFVDALDLAALGFDGAVPEETGRPSYHPATILKIYIYGYLNQVQSSRRLERECRRNLELIWLTGRLAPDFKTIADFRRDNGPPGQSREMVEHYAKQVNQLRLAAAAILKWEATEKVRSKTQRASKYK